MFAKKKSGQSVKSVKQFVMKKSNKNKVPVSIIEETWWKLVYQDKIPVVQTSNR
jgi:ribosomal protein L31E